MVQLGNGPPSSLCQQKWPEGLREQGGLEDPKTSLGRDTKGWIQPGLSTKDLEATVFHSLNPQQLVSRRRSSRTVVWPPWVS